MMLRAFPDAKPGRLGMIKISFVVPEKKQWQCDMTPPPKHTK